MPRSSRHMTLPKSDLPQGTLDLLILKVVALGPLHGSGDAVRIASPRRAIVDPAYREPPVRGQDRVHLNRFVDQYGSFANLLCPV